jgi:phosphopantothenoylcysteine decarboxylase/phosphopantothenate--cysteine ligase
MAGDDEKPLGGYEVLLCVTGGIASYKSADLTSKLIQAGAGVSVAMSEAAMRFVTPLVFQTLTQRQVFTMLWLPTEEYRSQHLSPTEAADLMAVAPATADIIAKFAAGLADELISTMALAATGTCPILLAPAMNARMWQSPPVQANMRRLKEWGYQVVGPDEGRLACGTTGPGRMAEPDEILQAIKTILLQKPPKKSV